MTDAELLLEFVKEKSQSAFTELVQRHIDWVYSTARRLVLDPHLAEDVTQAVFILVAQKAPQLAAHQQFNGWLFRTTRYCAANALKQQTHRRRHEKEAGTMRPEESPNEPIWFDIAPQLDAALARLNALDREALLLKFYQGKTAAEVAAMLGVTEEAAKKRLQRAVEKLRGTLTGAPSGASAASLMTVIAANATHTAPPQLAATATAAALTTAKSTLAAMVAKAVAETMWWAKLKIAAGLLAAATITAAAGYETVIHTLPSNTSPVAPAVASPVAAQPSPTPPPADTPIDFDVLYEKAPGSKPDLTMPLGPNTFAITAVIRFDPDGKPVATNNFGQPLDPASLPLAQIKPPSGAGITKDILLVQLTPARDRYDIDRLRLFNHATRRYINDVAVTPVPSMSALQIIAPPGTLPAQIDLWIAAASYDATSTPVNLPATKSAGVAIAGSTVSFADIRDGSWSFNGAAFTIPNGNEGEQTSLQLHATQPWTAGRYQIAAVSRNKLKYLSDFFVDFSHESAPILNFPFGLAQIDHFELRPNGRQRPFYFDGVTLPHVSIAPIVSPIADSVIVRATDSAQVDLPSGATVELAGIAHAPSTDHIWWGIDGAPVDGPRGESGGSVSSQDEYWPRELFARVYNVPRNRADILWQLPSSGGWGGGGDGKTSRIAANLPKKGPVIIRIGVPASPWKTLEEIPVEKLPAESQTWPGTIGALTQRGNDITLTRIVMSTPDNLRFVLVDNNGKLHSHNSYSSSGDDKLPPWGLQKAHLTYQNLKLEDIRAVRFETRSVEYAEFKNIPMEPR